MIPELDHELPELEYERSISVKGSQVEGEARNTSCTIIIIFRAVIFSAIFVPIVIFVIVIFIVIIIKVAGLKEGHDMLKKEANAKIDAVTASTGDDDDDNGKVLCYMKILVIASVREKIESLEQTVTTTRNAVAEVKLMRR